MAEGEGRGGGAGQIHERGQQPAHGRSVAAAHIGAGLHILVGGIVSPHIGKRLVEGDIVDGELALAGSEGLLVRICLGRRGDTQLGDGEGELVVDHALSGRADHHGILLRRGRGVGGEAGRQRGGTGAGGRAEGQALGRFGRPGDIGIGRDDDVRGNRRCGNFQILTVERTFELGREDLVRSAGTGRILHVVGEGLVLDVSIGGRVAAPVGAVVNTHVAAGSHILQVTLVLGEGILIVRAHPDAVVGIRRIEEHVILVGRVELDGSRTVLDDLPQEVRSRLQLQFVVLDGDGNGGRRSRGPLVIGHRIVRTIVTDDDEHVFLGHAVQGLLDPFVFGDDRGLVIIDIDFLDLAGGEDGVRDEGLGRCLLAVGTGHLDGDVGTGRGGEGLHGDVERGGGAGCEVGVFLNGQGSRLGHVSLTAGRKGGRRTGEVEIVGADDVHGGRQGDTQHLDGGTGHVLHVHLDHRGDLLHRHDGLLGDGNVLHDTVDREVRPGQMGHAVITSLLLRAGSGRSDRHIAGRSPIRFQAGRRNNIAGIRVEEIPVVGAFRQFTHFAGGPVGLGILHRELDIVGPGRRAGRCKKGVQLVVVDPGSLHSVVDGPGVLGVQDDLEGLVRTEEIDLLVTADEGEGGSSQTRKEKGFFHRLGL